LTRQIKNTVTKNMKTIVTSNGDLEVYLGMKEKHTFGLSLGHDWGRPFHKVSVPEFL
jgi:hypothetical protein